MKPIIPTTETHVIYEIITSNMYINHDNLIFFKRQKTGESIYKSNILTVDSIYIYKRLKPFRFGGSCILSGGTFINNTDTVFETKVDLYQGEYKINSQLTSDGKFNFKDLSPLFTYDIKATPLNTDFNPRIVPNLKPVIDNSSFKFLFYCHYDKKYKTGKPYSIRTVVYDTRGILKYNVDNAPIGLSIDESTGVISFNISTIGVYNFTVNCSDSLLELTKSIPMEIEIIA